MDLLRRVKQPDVLYSINVEAAKAERAHKVLLKFKCIPESINKVSTNVPEGCKID